jgi:predicted nucleic-acid-binding Zn-ribbon protein
MSVDFDKRDFTKIVDGTLPKSWKCPHCGERNYFDREAFECFEEIGKVMRHCKTCSYVHMWELELSDDFKRKVIATLQQICGLDENFNRGENGGRK